MFYLVTFFFSQVWSKVHHGMDLLCCKAEQSLEITHKSVHVTLASRLQNNILVVIISKTPRQLLVVHLGLVLPQPPPSCHLKMGQKFIMDYL